MNARHKSERLNFASLHAEDDYDFWIYADQTKCESHQVKLYRMRKPSRRPKVVGIYKRDRFKVNVWGAISSRGAALFVVIYIKILFKCTREKLQGFFISLKSNQTYIPVGINLYLKVNK